MARQFEYDLVIVGLGPAGATLARLASKNLSVLAIDRPRGGEKGFSKPCGGLLSPDAQKALSRFDLTLPREVLVDPQIFSVRTIDLAAGITRHYQRFYLNLDRDRFDQWLIAMLPESVRRAEGVCTGVRRENGGFALTYIEKGRTHTVTARFVAGADGAASAVRRNLFPKANFHRYVAIQQWFPERHRTPFYSCIFDPATSDCCSWSISKDNRFIFGGAFAPQGCRAAFEEQKRRLAEKCGFVFGTPLKTEACVVLRPKSPADFCTGKDGAFLLGEAAGFISPSSLEGISWAVDSARILARALERPEKADRAYAAGTRGIRLRLLLKRLKCPFLYWPPLRRLVMKSGLKTIGVIEE